MSRYTGPKRRIARAANFPIFDKEDYKLRPGKPGQHKGGRPNNSPYAEQFAEKQKVKKIYGMSEKQFRRFFAMAQSDIGNTGAKFLELLERRLDNVVYRLKLANSRPAARQLVAHGHILVNGKKLDIPSYIVDSGDQVTLKEKTKNNTYFVSMKESMKVIELPVWLEEYSDGGKVKLLPSRDMIDKTFRERLIVEFYSR